MRSRNRLTQTSNRRRFSALEKKRMVEETYKLGSSVSAVARQYKITPGLLYKWRRSMEAGALTGVDCEDNVVSHKEIKKLKARIRELENALGRKTLDNEILKAAVNVGREKKRISRQPLLGLDDFD